MMLAYATIYYILKVSKNASKMVIQNLLLLTDKSEKQKLHPLLVLLKERNVLSLRIVQCLGKYCYSEEIFSELASILMQEDGEMQFEALNCVLSILKDN